MEFIKFLMKESPEEGLYILMISVTQSVVAGLFPALVLHAAAEIVAGRGYMLWACLLAASIVIQIVTYQISESRTAILAEQRLERLVLGIADTLRRDELSDFECRNHAEIRLSLGEARATADATVQSVRVLQSLITLFVLWLYIFSLSGAAGVIFLLVFGLILLVMEVSQRISRDLFLEVAAAENRLFDVFRHFLDGFRDIRISFRKGQDIFANHLKPLIREIQSLRHRGIRVQTDFMVCTVTATSFLAGIDVFFLSPLNSLDVITQLIVCTLYAVKPAWMTLSALPGIAQGRAALARLQRLSPEEPRLRKPLYEPGKEIIDTFHTLTLQKIFFIYHEPDGTPGFSIGPISLPLRAGEVVFLAGGNGSGKSTFVKLLVGLYPASGRVMIDENRVSLSGHRHLFSAVFSDFHLFDALYGVEKPDERQIRDMLARMRLTGKTDYADGRFTTLDLSAGQRRRLALVVALHEDRPIFVFDEWAADQDPDFRRWFYEELLPSLKEQGKTVLAVTHDDGYYHLADRVITMRDGKIADDRHPGRESEERVSVPDLLVPAPEHTDEDGRTRREHPDPEHSDEDQDHAPETPAFLLRQLTPVLRRLGGWPCWTGSTRPLISTSCSKSPAFHPAPPKSDGYSFSPL